MPDIRKFSRLRSLRKAAGFTQRALASIINQPSSSIGFWEVSGKMPPAELLPRIAQTFGVSVDNLLGVEKKSVPRGKAFLAFEDVSKLPRKEQKYILGVVNALVAQCKKKNHEVLL